MAIGKPGPGLSWLLVGLEVNGKPPLPWCPSSVGNVSQDTKNYCSSDDQLLDHHFTGVFSFSSQLQYKLNYTFLGYSLWVFD